LKKVLVLMLTLLLTLTSAVNVLAVTNINTSSIVSTSSTTGGQSPESVIAEDIKAQNDNDNTTYLNIRSEKEVAPECQSIIKSINQNQPNLDVMKDVTSAKLVSVKELPSDLAANLTNINLYKQTWSEVKTYYVAIDYKVKKESRWFYNGLNYRLMVLALENNRWVIAEESMAPVPNIVEAGQGFGTKEESIVKDLLTNRAKTAKFYDLQGQLIEDNADKPDQITKELRSNNAKAVNAALTAQIANNSISGITVQPNTTFTPPSTIRVYRTSTGTVDYVSFDYYVKHVLPYEWLDSWPAVSLQSGAMAVKMYGWYFTLHPHSSSYDVKDDTTDQKYVPGDISQFGNCTAAVDATNGTLITNSDAVIFITHYWAGYYAAGRYGPPSCPTDGWLWQNGSDYWANNGATAWLWIVNYAYNNSDTDGYLPLSMYFY